MSKSDPRVWGTYDPTEADQVPHGGGDVRAALAAALAGAGDPPAGVDANQPVDTRDTLTFPRAEAPELPAGSLVSDAALIRLGRRVAGERTPDDPDLLGAALDRLGHTEGNLLAALACTPAQLATLRLCGRPRLASYPVDLATIAARCGIDPDRLRALLREDR